MTATRPDLHLRTTLIGTPGAGFTTEKECLT